MKITWTILLTLFLCSCDFSRPTKEGAVEIAKNYALENVPIGDYKIEDYHIWVWYDDADKNWNVKFAHRIHGKEMINEDGSIEAVAPGCPESFGITVDGLFGYAKDIYHC